MRTNADNAVEHKFVRRQRRLRIRVGNAASGTPGTRRHFDIANARQFVRMEAVVHSELHPIDYVTETVLLFRINE